MNEIATLNDNFRRSFVGGKVIMTQGISAFDDDKIDEICIAVKTFTDFTEENDPYDEHDFGSFTMFDKKIYWKIDYYDRSLRYASPDPSIPGMTTRVLTILLAEEY